MKTNSNPQPTQGARADHLAILGLTGLWLALILVVDPRGDFPLLDDWSYARSVKVLVEQGKLYYDGWNSMTLFLQVLYGALFCLPFGFSFEALRISTLVAGLAGSVGTYALLRQVSTNRLVAVIGSLTVMLNPAYFQFSFTFMTDVPFAALAVISAIFYLRALRTGSIQGAVVGTLLACCATLVRQIGIAIPLGYGLTLLATSVFGKRVLLRSLWPLGVTVAVLLVYNAIIDHLHLTPALQGAVQESMLNYLNTQGPAQMVLHSLHLGEALFAHTALYVLPCLLVLLTCRFQGQALSTAMRRWLIAASPVLLLLVHWRFWAPKLPSQVFNNLVGGHQLVGGQYWGAYDEPILWRQTIWLAEVAATAGLLFLLAMAIAYSRRREFAGKSDAAALLFAITTPAMMLGPFMLDRFFFERYLIPALPFFLLALVALSKPADSFTMKGTRALAAVGGMFTLTVYAALSVLYTHDTLLWNRTRWDAVNYLVREQAIDPARIDGGLSANGWYLFPVDGPLRKRYVNIRSERGLWWRNDAADYTIAFSRREDEDLAPNLSRSSVGRSSDVVWRKSYDGWLPGADGAIVIHHKLSSADKTNLEPTPLHKK
jgi:Dolichyl-phosphate-mannose-protein mannosyltransferase